VPVVSIRLKSEPSVALLVLDVVIGLFSLQSALETDNPFWIRAVCVVVALVAWVMAIREALLLVQRLRQVPR
jgi:protein-S-isoprenylcysteine O-methyltransferase Ste14